jgi:hypothetical protein
VSDTVLLRVGAAILILPLEDWVRRVISDNIDAILYREHNEPGHHRLRTPHTIRREKGITVLRREQHYRYSSERHHEQSGPPSVLRTNGEPQLPYTY